MKKIVLLLFVRLAFYSHAQTSVYHPFPESNAFWNVHYVGSWFICQEEFTYKLIGDTIISNLTYHKIEVPFIQSQGTCSQIHSVGYNGCIREDTAARRVYYLSPSSSTEELLYDFNLQVGDSIPGFLRYNCYSSTVAVIGIDSVLIGSEYRKRWITGHAIPYNVYNYIIEGIGFQTGLLQQCPDNGADAAFYVLQCFQQNGVTLFPDTLSSCILIDHIDNSHSASTPYVFPNPFKNFLTVESQSNKAFEIILFDMSMRKLLEENFVRYLNLETGNFAKGLYFYEIKNDGNTFSRGKVIKD